MTDYPKSEFPDLRLHNQEVWLIGERRTTGEQKYYLSNLPADASLKRLAAAIKDCAT